MVGTQEKSLAMNLFGGWDYSINSSEAIKKQQKATRYGRSPAKLFPRVFFAKLFHYIFLL